MNKILKKIFYLVIDGCNHEWKILNVRPVDHYERSFGTRQFLYRAIACQCKKCGKLSQYKDPTGAVEPESLMAGRK